MHMSHGSHVRQSFASRADHASADFAGFAAFFCYARARIDGYHCPRHLGSSITCVCVKFGCARDVGLSELMGVRGGLGVLHQRSDRRLQAMEEKWRKEADPNLVPISHHGYRMLAHLTCVLC